MENEPPKDADSNSMIPRVELFGTERRTISSSIVNEEFDLYINFPKSYWEPGKKSNYPVLYSLNAQWDFQLVAGIFGNLFYDGLVEEIIIVGITWGGVYPDYLALANRDFTPTSSNQFPGSGGAEKFLSVIENEIIPFVNIEYPVTGDKGLTGSSNAGLFMFYVMFHKPFLFNRFVISSPLVQWENNFLFNYETAFSNKHNQLPIRVFITWGEYEEASSLKRFLSQMVSKNYRGLTLETAVINNTGHAGNKPEGYTQGILYAYKRANLSLPLNDLKKYIGIYLYNNIKFQISEENKYLIFKWNETDMGSRMYVQNEDLFYILGRYILFHFKKENDIITQMKIELMNATYEAIKLN